MHSRLDYCNGTLAGLLQYQLNKLQSILRAQPDLFCYYVYLSEFCVPLSSQAGHSQLRSAAVGDLLIPPTRTVTIGGRGFSVAGPVAWNSLPMDLKDGTLTFPVFKKLLKTHLFDTI